MIWTSAPSGARVGDRADVLAALDQRALTGVPRHLDHDEGEELQDAVTAALKANPTDGEMAWAALRASFPIVPRAAPVIYDSMPSIGVETLSPFALPWRVAADVSIDASVDGSGWHHALDHASRQGPIPIAKLFPTAARPGFHAVRLRATLEFSGQPGFLPASDIRELPVVTYGITGPTPAGQRVDAILMSAARANASDIDRNLPPIPFGTWLRTVAATPGSPIFWTAAWCVDRTGADDEREPSICARATVGASRQGGHAEVWVKIATVDPSGTKPTWTAVPPTLDGVDLIDGPRATADLASVPSALRSSVDAWPHASLALRAVGVSPATPQPGEPVTIVVQADNTGTSDLIGTGIDLVVGDSDQGPALAHRQFVRSIPAGGSVIVEMQARFPRGYGVVSVLIWPGNHTTFRTLLADGAEGSATAWRVVRPDLAPPGFATRMGAAIGCIPGCRVR